VGKRVDRGRLPADLLAELLSRSQPLKEAFSKIKRLVRKAEARTSEALFEALGSALSAITSRDGREPDLGSNGRVFMGPREPISIDLSPHIPLQQTTVTADCNDVGLTGPALLTFRLTVGSISPVLDARVRFHASLAPPGSMSAQHAVTWRRAIETLPV